MTAGLLLDKLLSIRKDHIPQSFRLPLISKELDDLIHLVREYVNGVAGILEM